MGPAALESFMADEHMRIASVPTPLVGREHVGGKRGHFVQVCGHYDVNLDRSSTCMEL